MLIFGGVHKLNGSYVGYMFFVAMIFRLAMNYSIYVLGIFLTFTLGIHHSNNAIWHFTEYGSKATIDALSSLGGMIIMVWFGLIVFYTLKNIDSVSRKLKVLFSFGR